MDTSNDVTNAPGLHLQIRHVSWLEPLHWLRYGWQDLRHHAGASVAYGLLVTGMGFIILAFATYHAYIMAAAVSGFLLVGPVLATGLCELSRRREQQKQATFDDSLDALSRHGRALTHFAGVLFGLSVLWFLVSGLILETFVGTAVPDINQAVWGDFTNRVSLSLIMVYIAIGGILALVVFALSVVSVPAIIDRDASASESMGASARVTAANIPAMLVWAGLIVILTAIGFATFLLGMIVIYPLLGHATWYAYKDLISSS